MFLSIALLAALIPVNTDSQATMQKINTNDEQRLSFLGQSYRFKPTDEELVSYLERKLAGHSIPSHLIPQVDIYKFSPHQLKARYQRNGDDSMFFFSPRNRKFLNGTRPDRRVGDIGYWKSSRTVRLKSKNSVVGTKMILNFHVGTPKKSTNTHWIMEEFILKEKSAMTHQNLATSSANPLDKKFDDFCLYKIHYHKTKADKQERHDIQELEIPNQVPQNGALESQSQQNQPYWIMPIDTFNPTTSTSAATTTTATPAHSTHYLGNCEPITPFLNNGNYLLPAPYMGESTFSTTSMPLDTFIPATATSTPAHSCYYSSNSEPITPFLNNGNYLLPAPYMGESTFSMTSMPLDTFIPATATSTPAHSCYYSSNSEPITPIFNSVDHSATLLSVSTTSIPADSIHYLGNCEPITPIFNNVDHLATPLAEPSMEDSATMLSDSTASTPAIESQSQQNQPSMVMSIGTFNPAASTSAPTTATTTPAHSTQFLGNCESIADFLDDENCLAAALFQATSIGDCTPSMSSMLLDTLIPETATSTAGPAHSSYYSSNGEALEDSAAQLSVSTAPTPPHSTPATPSMPCNDNGFMLPQWPTVDEQSTTEDFGAFNLLNSPVNDRSTNEDFDGFNLWSWNF
ncbi:hypothetical protein L6164_023756 [Bauhinia variegata]|uniref:Uncharacterized protein n=1 Tax=Bauhinia variegata TaxID=167791 RepID=A0ACB9MJL8_BAUVA|nr:hypothetical protein L6164_023756 [Bauhinia variegata]